VCNLYSFFFSSRRRHTRFSRDWSSDVCSSDLLLVTELEHVRGGQAGGDLGGAARVEQRGQARAGADRHVEAALGADLQVFLQLQIGRASCRERLETSDVVKSILILCMDEILYV